MFLAVAHRVFGRSLLAAALSEVATETLKPETFCSLVGEAPSHYLSIFRHFLGYFQNSGSALSSASSPSHQALMSARDSPTTPIGEAALDKETLDRVGAKMWRATRSGSLAALKRAMAEVPESHRVALSNWRNRHVRCLTSSFPLVPHARTFAEIHSLSAPPPPRSRPRRQMVGKSRYSHRNTLKPGLRALTRGSLARPRLGGILMRIP